MALASSVLTTLAKLKDELGISVSTYDTKLERKITAATSLITRFVGRTLHYEAAVVEGFAGFGTNEILTRKTPVWSIASITYDGATLDSSAYEIKDAEAGLILYTGALEAGWLWDTPRNAGVAQDPQPGGERKLYVATYAAGWYTPEQGATPPTGVDSLPSDIEEAALQLAATLFLSGGQDQTIKSESALGYSVQRAAVAEWQDGLPPGVANMLRPYRYLEQGS